ncbi:hypothetical protein E0485_15125 [Paenibacillus albiflavus]|uniref:Uncharacterized protein n=1 Tax=Paenibacillus albiflavus TaxID=2545760 RepID=A0A4R4EDS3_9BACL|nr:hypothetical protein [Paenibacillus albiflavus]TCZ76168.1 hypothetical protein E0485_15125 [Paenibacillus albiflavus]
MKATIGEIVLEGTPKEIAEYEKQISTKIEYLCELRLLLTEAGPMRTSGIISHNEHQDIFLRAINLCKSIDNDLNIEHRGTPPGIES